MSAVDEWFAGHAEPNMPDGSFNAALTLQQSTEYEAERQAAELEGRISRGLVGATGSAVCWHRRIRHTCNMWDCGFTAVASSKQRRHVNQSIQLSNTPWIGLTQ